MTRSQDGCRRLMGRGRAVAHVARDCALVLLVVPAGCGGGSDPGVQVATDTDGVVTTGVDGGEGVDGGDQGLDESGDEPPYYCIYNSNNAGLTGVKHQCNLEYDLDITFTVTPLVGEPFEVPLSAFAVLTVSDESTYEHPFVMACCTDIRDAASWPYDDTCGTQHHKACMSDFIQHVCNAPGNWLAATADDFLGNGKEAIEAAAQWLNEHKQECYEHFWLGPDLLHDAMYCEPEFDGFFDHTPWEPSETFQYVVFDAVVAEVSNIVVAPRSSLGENVPLAPPDVAEACSNPAGNDGEVPPLSSLEPVGGSFAPVAPAPIEAVGPELAGEVVHGSGDIGTDSLLQWSKRRDALDIERWVMTEAAPATIGTSAGRVDVDHFKLALDRATTAKASRVGWHVDPGAALFTLGATVAGTGSSVQARNSTSIELHTVDGVVDACPTRGGSCLVSGEFTIVYEDDLGQRWKLSVPTITWQP
jgi:hypothetical protein